MNQSPAWELSQPGFAVSGRGRGRRYRRAHTVHALFSKRIWVFRLSCEPGIGDCTAQVLRTRRKVHENRELLPPRRQERQVRKFNFFAAFAPLREIFRFLVAASPRGASVVKISSHQTRKNQKVRDKFSDFGVKGPNQTGC